MFSSIQLSSECFGVRLCPWMNSCSYVSICLHAHVSVCSPLDSFFFFFMYWNLFLEWPSKSHGVQPCCPCAPACVIQFEWRKPRDTSVALSRLRSSTVCRWFFEGANLEALWLKGSGPVRVNSQRNTWTPMRTVYIRKHSAQSLSDMPKDSSYSMAECIVVLSLGPQSCK